ncbi:hypothetical protein FACS1894132_14830 [Clostridia bacterium]|nr:hypothetical protein FACS1894132_14830 [Clostridia bacterium]
MKTYFILIRGIIIFGKKRRKEQLHRKAMEQLEAICDGTTPIRFVTEKDIVDHMENAQNVRIYHYDGEVEILKSNDKWE